MSTHATRAARHPTARRPPDGPADRLHAEPSEYADRTARLSELAQTALRSRTPIAGGERLTFAPGAGIEQRLRDVVAAEAACCAFLRMDLRAESQALVLDITGPADAEPIIAELFA